MATSPGHKALRRGRVSERGRIYHVTFATTDRVARFLEWECASAVCRTLESSASATHVDLLCWVLMPDHFHALAQLQGSQSLSRHVQRLKGRATLAYRAVHADDTDIWARGYYDRAIRRHEDVKAVARYIIANPLRAGLVDDVLDYPYWNAKWL